MRRTCLVGVTSILLVAIAGLVSIAGPSIVVIDPVYDFGVVVEGETVTHTFIIENHGDEVLRITNVIAGCGCTTTSLAVSILEPGRGVRLGVDVSTAGYGGLQISKQVYIKSNDPDAPQVVLTIEGTVVNAKPFLIDSRTLSGSLMFLIDLRDTPSYAAGHLIGAISLPYIEGDWWLSIIPKQARVVLYDQKGSVSMDMAEEMLKQGFTNVQVLTGGIDEWIHNYGDRLITTAPLVIPREASK